MGCGTKLLDLCAGTGEIALRYCKTYPNVDATLLDFCPEMLEIAKAKLPNIKTLCADVQKIPLPDKSFDAITIAYGIRNVENRSLCFQEVRRLLTSKGHFGILELTRPKSFLLKQPHKLYTKAILPLIGKILSGNADAYRYLASSIQNFTTPHALCDELIKAGLIPIKTISLFGGIASIIIACPSS